MNFEILLSGTVKKLSYHEKTMQAALEIIRRENTSYLLSKEKDVNNSPLLRQLWVFQYLLKNI